MKASQPYVCAKFAQKLKFSFQNSKNCVTFSLVRGARMKSQAFVAETLEKRGNTLIENIAAIAGGVILLSLLAQVAIPLPFTPVPITGQTFGVALIALMWGAKRGGATVFTYLLVGAAGLPVFANAQAGLAIGPTMGYLLGMLLASFAMGTLADKGFTKTFKKAYAAAFLGSLITFTCGYLVLGYFVGYNHAFALGVVPFIPGDILKTLLAARLSLRK
jgi:biotin transport system substrate-specific component